MSDSLQPHGLPTRVLCPWDSPGKSTRVGGHALLQGIFATQGLNPGLLHCSWFLYQLSHQGSPPYLVFMTQFKQCPFLGPSHLLPQPKGSPPLCSPGALITGTFVFVFGCTMQHMESYFPDHGIEPESALEEQSLNRWTPREVPECCYNTYGKESSLFSSSTPLLVWEFSEEFPRLLVFFIYLL